MREGVAGGHHVVDEEHGASADAARVRDGEGADEVLAAFVAGEARLVFGVADAAEGTLVDAAVDAASERAGEEGALVVAARAEPVGVEGHGHDHVHVGWLQLGADRSLKQIGEILCQPHGRAELEFVQELVDGFLVDDGAACAFVGGLVFRAGLADEIVRDLRDDRGAADAAAAVRLVEGQSGETGGTEVAAVAVHRARARLHRADARPDAVENGVEDLARPPHAHFPNRETGYSPASTRARMAFVTNGLSSR